MINNQLLFTFVCLTIAQGTLSLSEDEFGHLKALYDGVKDQISGPMATLSDELFENLTDYDGLKKFVTAPSGIAFVEHNYISFTATYQMRKESKFYQSVGHGTVPTSPYLVPAEVRIYIEKAPADEDIEFEDIPRWKKAISFASLTCFLGSQIPAVKDMEDGAVLIGNHAHYGRPYRGGFQRFYEQEFGTMDLDNGEGKKTYFVNVMVAEGWDALLTQPLAPVYDGINEDDFTRIILSLSYLGDSLTGNHILYPGLTLDNMGINKKLLLDGNIVFNPFVRLNDGILATPEDADYQDTVNRFTGEYATKIYTESINNESGTPVYTYSKELYEDAFALMVAMSQFLTLNNATNNNKHLAGIWLVLRLGKIRTGNTGTYAKASTPEDVYLNLIKKLKETGFLRSRLLI
jgi:hypothetical protein